MRRLLVVLGLGVASVPVVAASAQAVPPSTIHQTIAVDTIRTT